ncbi:MAG: TRIC cation channel family protein [Candidatus Udaeobacter sp.]
MLSYVVTAIMIGIVTACAGGLLRDVLVIDEPLLFNPGQLYALAALIRASMFTLLILYFKMPATTAALLAIGCCSVLRMLAIAFDWKTVSVLPTSPEQSGIAKIRLRVCCYASTTAPHATCLPTSFSLRPVP